MHMTKIKSSDIRTLSI